MSGDAPAAALVQALLLATDTRVMIAALLGWTAARRVWHQHDLAAAAAENAAAAAAASPERVAALEAALERLATDNSALRAELEAARAARPLSARTAGPSPRAAAAATEPSPTRIPRPPGAPPRGAADEAAAAPGSARGASSAALFQENSALKVSLARLAAENEDLAARIVEVAFMSARGPSPYDRAAGEGGEDDGAGAPADPARSPIGALRRISFVEAAGGKSAGSGSDDSDGGSSYGSYGAGQAARSAGGAAGAPRAPAAAAVFLEA